MLDPKDDEDEPPRDFSIKEGESKILLLNKEAMTAKGVSALELNDSLHLLREAEYFLKGEFYSQIDFQVPSQSFIYNKLLSITHNNFACIYKKLNKPELAFDFL